MELNGPRISSLSPISDSHIGLLYLCVSPETNPTSQHVFILNFKQERFLEEETEGWKRLGKNKNLKIS